MPPKKSNANAPFKGQAFHVALCDDADDVTSKVVNCGGKVLKTLGGKTLTHVVVQDKNADISDLPSHLTIVTVEYVNQVGDGKTPDAATILKQPTEESEEESEEEEAPKRAPSKRAAAAAAKKADDDEEEEEAKSKAKKRGRAAKKDDDDDEDSDADVKPTKKAAKKNADADAATTKPTTITVTGNVSSKKSYPTDYRVPNPENWVVVTEQKSDGSVFCYDFMLNQTSTGGANHNKFYLVQVLRHVTNPNSFATIFVWGRIGENGQNTWLTHSSFAAAVAAADKKIKDKSTHNIATIKANPHVTTRADKYTYLRRAIPQADDEDEDDAEMGEDEDAKSKLHPRVQSFMSLISDVQMVKSQLVEIGLNIEKSPLGALDKEVLKRGMTILKELEDEVKKDKPSKSQLDKLSSQYYTLIPHDFGRKQPPTIKDDDTIKKEFELCQALADVEAGQKVLTLKQNKAEKHEEHPLDAKYKAMDVNLHYVDPKSATYKLIHDYMTNTVGATHTWFDAEIVDIIAVDKEIENTRQEEWLKTQGDFTHNRQLLWHGSKIMNYVGILSSSLRLPKNLSPSVPICGAMFDGGCYSADASSKSFQYCSTNDQGEGVIMLLEVVGGDHEHMYSADYHASHHMRPNSKSVKGLGKFIPGESGAKYIKFGEAGQDPEIFTRDEIKAAGKELVVDTDTAKDSCRKIHPVTHFTSKDNTLCKVPMGKLEQSPGNIAGLYYNEIICYNVEQIKIKYCIRYKSKNYKSRY